jgi:hypothetical protein
MWRCDALAPRVGYVHGKLYVYASSMEYLIFELWVSMVL